MGVFIPEDGEPTGSEPGSYPGTNSGDHSELNYYDYETFLKSEHPVPGSPGPPGAVRVEEITIVTLILILWLCAILLFVHRWGKIRMLVPHQPRYDHYAAQANDDKLKVCFKNSKIKANFKN